MIFDLDGTLCDYRSARPHGLATISGELARHGIDVERFRAEFERVGVELKPDLQAGRLNRREYNVARFESCISRCRGRLPDPAALRQLQRRYEDAILDNIAWVDDARDGFAATAARHPVAILTNGETRLQHEKVRRLGIIADGVFVSDEVGLCKPDPDAFRNVAHEFGALVGDVVMVGDSLRNDALPAAAIGMRAILVGDAGARDAWHGESASSVDEVAFLLSCRGVPPAAQ